VGKTRGSIPDRVKKGSIPAFERLYALDKVQLHAILATVSDEQPYTSMIAYALAPDERGIVFATPSKTQKYKNILKNNRVSILIDTRSNTTRDYMSAESLTILGYAKPVRKGKKWRELTNILLKKHPKLNEFIYSSETKVIFVKITQCLHVTQFQAVSKYVVR
jgi:nitroimidazol reductase NimA-like FMN-containing flavoprotein (pyridoxamine 5'-phosphate oxidase superfamily)